MSTDFCSQQSYQMGIEPYGTASEAMVWLLLEYHGEWRNQALEDNDLPPAVQAWLHDAQRCIPRSRPLLIRSEKPRATRSFYIIDTTPHRPTLYHVPFDDYSELLSYDPQQIIQGHSQLSPSDEKLFLVCTNGKRDQCCAKFGLPIYQAFQSQEGIHTWQCTHIGGHRFASTGIVFPSGVTYGYITEEQVPSLAQAIRADQVLLPLYRGRTAYSAWVNAAEYFLRKQEQLLADADLTWRTSEQVSADVWQIMFSDAQGKSYRVQLNVTQHEPLPSSCFQPYKPQARFHLQHIEQVD
ncbi:MAG: sucrase ferredoxin [Phototrophicaceae bacterium]